MNERNDEENVLINDGQFDEEEEEDDDDDEDDEPIEIDASDDDVEGNEVEDPLDDQNEPQVNQQMDIIRNEANVLFNEVFNCTFDFIIIFVQLMRRPLNVNIF